MKFCDILKNLIAEHNLTQKQLAHDLRIPVSTLGGYVQGTSEPDFEMLKLFASYFHTTTDFLLGFNSDLAKSKEDALLRIFRMISPSQQDIYIEQGKAFLKTEQRDNK